MAKSGCSSSRLVTRVGPCSSSLSGCHRAARAVIVAPEPSERQKHDSVYPLFRLRSSPDQEQLVDGGCGGGALRDDQHARAILSADERGEVVRHRSAVVRDQYSSLIGGPFEHIQVMKGLEPSLQRRSNQARLASPQTGDDILVEVLVGLESNPQDFVGSRLRALLSFS